MAQLIVRNLAETVKRRLRAQAKSHGRSMEEEAREIIRGAVTKDTAKEQGFGMRFASYFAGKVPKEFKPLEMRGKVSFPKLGK